MADISLRTYNQEIKDLIDHGHFDEAIAHCQHILETFPRHVETYRLLGKAFLEQGRHGDAADVFQRVLSAVPDDWIAHVAMAIIREDESNLDMAIWHMERAYEVNPSNTTVQGEIRRLRGKRDGVEPAKLRLTRSALARMYIKGGLFGQAIAEVRSALAEDPDRPDLLILLASALYESGSMQEAADICNMLLQKLPYCMEANRILGMVLWSTDKKDDAEKLFQRLESLDPYIDPEAIKSGNPLGEHPAHSITLLRIEYEQQERTTRSKQPAWASSLGLQIEGQKTQSALPDWLAAPAASAALAKPSIPAMQAKPETPSGTPSWVREAAASAALAAAPTGSLSKPSAPSPVKSTGTTGALPDWIKTQPAPETPGNAPAPAGHLPDWLSAPAGAAPVEPPAVKPAESGLPDWIKTAAAPAPEATPMRKTGGLPDWLTSPSPPAVEGLPSSSLPDWARPETTTGPLAPESAAGLPGWLNPSAPQDGIGTAELNWIKSAASTPRENAKPEWMQDVPPIGGSATAESALEVPEWLRSDAGSTKPKPAEIVPDWMREEESPASPKPAGKAPTSSAPSTSAMFGTEPASVPDWMKPEPTPAEKVASSDIRSALFPSKAGGSPATTEPVQDWMKEPEAATPAQAVTPAAEFNIPEWMTPPSGIVPDVPKAAPVATSDSNLPDWMQGPSEAIAASAGPISQEPSVTPAEGLPDWLIEPSGASPAPIAPPIAPAARKETTAASEGSPDWLRGAVSAAPEVANPADAGPNVEPAEALPDWLSGTSTPVMTDQAKSVLPGPIAGPSEGMPDWLTAPSTAAAEPQKPVAEEPEPAPAEGMPDWLKGPAAEAAKAIPPESNDKSALVMPDWLKGITPAEEPEEVPAPKAGLIEPPPMPPSAAVVEPPPIIQTPKVEAPATSEPALQEASATGVDLPEWLLQQLQGAPKEAEPAPKPGVIPASSAPLPDWLKPATPAAGSPKAIDWDSVAKQTQPSILPSEPVRAPQNVPPAAPKTPPAQADVPGWLEKPKPGGGDTVARWLDRRLKTSTLSSLDEIPGKGEPIPTKMGSGVATPPGAAVQPPVPVPEVPATAAASPTPAPSTSSSGQRPEMPTWLDSKSPGASDTVVRWIDKRAPATGRLVMKPEAALKPEVRSAGEPTRKTNPLPEANPPAAPDQSTAEMPPWLDRAKAGSGDTVDRWLLQQSEKEARAPTAGSAPQTAPAASVPTATPPPAAPKLQPADEEEDGAFVPPPEWLQQALGSVVKDVPPIPSQPALKPVPEPAAPPSARAEPDARRWERTPVEEPPPAAMVEPGRWMPVTPPQSVEEKPAKSAPRPPAKKKARKITELEAEVLLKEARVYLETDLGKAAEAYQKVLEAPTMAETVVGDIKSYLEQDPDSAPLWNLLGDACSRAGHLQDAYQAYAEALKRM